MTSGEIIERLKELLAAVQELAALRDPALEGDIQILLAVLVDKLRYLDPAGDYPHQVEYE
ncbi:MAG: hypothetical protein ACE5H9_00325 [Anaerolineae bacterium]